MKDLEFVIAVFESYGLPIKTETDLKAVSVDFKNKEKVHDWRNHVSDFYVENWDSLTFREKAIIYCEAQYQADNEQNWEE